MEKVIEQLERMNKTLEGILDFIKKPESKIFIAFQYAGGVVGILGIVAIIDIVKTWIIGG
jgi:hypothetical protein